MFTVFYNNLYINYANIIYSETLKTPVRNFKIFKIYKTFNN